ncbi:MAG: response regulator [Desulfarculaceae bacterium]|nr:response regulator [Desulfarculaceae bacterium]MCF8072849.1 response regulator [Desulfarculaceae bacterium]MCF8101017.1 response regulator [Desulfarculaceae bacterium]MCF8115596.1 response regulator [Desulfarculaceae bacterium]
MRVLLIDDEKELVTTLSERLDIRGIDNDWATSGESGLELAKQQPYDCVVVDLKMPGLGGLETIKAIKQEQPDTRVIILTGHSSGEDMDSAMDIGTYRYLVKPVDIEDLLDLMQA